MDFRIGSKKLPTSSSQTSQQGQEVDDWQYPSLLPDDSIHPKRVSMALGKEQVLQSLGMYHFVCKQLETNTDITVTQISIIIWLDL